MTPVIFHTDDATTEAALYTVPSGKVAQVWAYITERGGAGDTFRVGHVKSGESGVAARHYRAFDKAIAANDTEVIGPLYMNAGEAVWVGAGSANVSITVNGYEK